MTIAVPSTGPTGRAPTTIAALERRLAGLEHAVRNLQINRTPPPITLGALSNMDASVNGTGLTGGETPIYDAASGTYKPGHAGGNSLPSLGYEGGSGPSGYLCNNFPASTNDAFLVEAGAIFPTNNQVFGVITQGTPAHPTAGIYVTNNGVLTGWGPNDGTTPLLAVSLSQLFAGGSEDMSQVVPLTPIGGNQSSSATSSPQTCFPALYVCQLGTVATPQFSTSSGVAVFIDCFITNTTGTEFLRFVAAAGLGPGSAHSFTVPDCIVIVSIGSQLSLSTTGFGPVVVTSVPDVYQFNCAYVVTAHPARP